MKAHMQVSILVTALLIVVVTACNDNSVTTSPAPFFPQQRDPKPDSMNALLVGELVIVDGCLRVNDSDGNNYLLVWPRDFSLRTENNVIQVIDDTGRSVAQVGDKLEVSGGEVPAKHVVELSVQPLPSGCPGPYWIVGSQISR